MRSASSLITFQAPNTAGTSIGPGASIIRSQSALPARRIRSGPPGKGSRVHGAGCVAYVGSTARSLEIPGLWHRDPLPMGAQIGPLVFSSVIGGQDPESGNVVAHPEAQITQAFANTRLFMEQAGGSLDDINHLWVFLQDGFKHHDFMVETWLKTFPDEHSRPARKTLPYKLGGDLQIQIQLTGVLSGRRRNFEIENVHHNDPIPMGSRIGQVIHSSGLAGQDPVKGKGARSQFGPTATFMVRRAAFVPETEMALEHVRTFMHNAGATFDDVTQLTNLVRSPTV